jgi:carbon monoxide dehydrogenase subunit G
VIKKFAILLVAALGLTMGAAFFLPRAWRVEQQIVIAAPPAKVHAMLFDLKRWQEWSVWTRALDPLLRNTYEGPQDGVGARWLWLGPTMGRGQIVIVASDPERGIELDQAIESEMVNSHATLSLTREGEGTRVTWIDEGTLPPVVGGFFRATVEQELASNLERSLQKLKALLEVRPEG